MTAVLAVAADEAWASALASPVGGAVESSFDHALNVQVDAGLLTVLARGGRRAPGALLTDAVRLPRLPAGTAVAISRDAVTAPGLTVRVSVAEPFDCRVAPLGEWTPLDVAALGRLDDLVEELMVPGSFRTGPSAGAFERALATRLMAGADVFGAALTQHRQGWAGASERLAEAAAGMVGLGVGLTPSGDDYLTGALAVLTLAGDTRALGVLSRAITGLLGQTTAVGALFLAAALTNRLHEDLHAAARAALLTSPDLPDAIGRVAAIGSTSGTDALRGLADAVRSCSVSPSVSSRQLRRSSRS